MFYINYCYLFHCLPIFKKPLQPHACRKAISNPRRARRRGGAKPDATLPSLDPWSDSHGFKMIYHGKPTGKHGFHKNI